MVSDFGMIPLILMPLDNHSPFYFAHHNAKNVELNIWRRDSWWLAWWYLLSSDCNASIPERHGESYYQYHQ